MKEASRNVRDLSKLPIQEQKDILCSMIEQKDVIYPIDHTHLNLRIHLDELKFKPSAIKDVIEERKETLSPEILQILHNKRIHQYMTPPKQNVPVDDLDKRPEGGAHEGRLVTKSPEKPKNKSKEKYQNIWLEKHGEGGEDDHRIDAVLAEYIGTHLMHEMMGDERSPKLRLYKQNGHVRIMSKYIKDFETIKDSSHYGIGGENLEIKGFARFFAANASLGDYDVNHGNVGARTINGEDFWARIDNDCAFSYREKNIKDKFAIKFKEAMIKSLVYKKEMFDNFNFACELIQETEIYNKENFRTIIQIGIKHLNSIYEKDILEDPDVKQALAQRMGLDKENITAETIEEKIIANINKVQEQLATMAKKQISAIFPSHPKLAMKLYLEAKTPYGIDPKMFFNLLKEQNIDINNPEHFNQDQAIKGLSFPENAMTSRDFIEQGIIYPALQNTEASVSSKKTAMFLATKLNLKNHVGSFITQGFNLEETDQKGRTVLHMATQRNYKQLASMLLKQGANPNKSDKERRTPLHFAAEKGCNALVSTLLERGAIPNKFNKEGKTPLHLAAENGDPNSVLSLIEKGAMVNIPDKSRSTALLIAAESGHLDAVSILLEEGSDIDTSERDDGRSPLFLAASKGHEKVVYKLLENGANPNLPDKEALLVKDEFPQYFNDEAILELFRKAMDNNNDIVVRNLLRHHDHLRETAKVYISENINPNISALIYTSKELREIQKTRKPLKDISNHANRDPSSHGR